MPRFRTVMTEDSCPNSMVRYSSAATCSVFVLCMGACAFRRLLTRSFTPAVYLAEAMIQGSDFPDFIVLICFSSFDWNCCSLFLARLSSSFPFLPFLVIFVHSSLTRLSYLSIALFPSLSLLPSYLDLLFTSASPDSDARSVCFMHVLQSRRTYTATRVRFSSLGIQRTTASCRSSWRQTTTWGSCKNYAVPSRRSRSPADRAAAATYSSSPPRRFRTSRRLWTSRRTTPRETCWRCFRCWLVVMIALELGVVALELPPLFALFRNRTVHEYNSCHPFVCIFEDVKLTRPDIIPYVYRNDLSSVLCVFDRSMIRMVHIALVLDVSCAVCGS